MTLPLSILSAVSYPGYTFEFREGQNGGLELRAWYMEADVDKRDGPLERQNTRWWVISKWATKSEIVQTCFKCILTSFEHRAREHFTYRGRAVFGPHFDVDALWEICDKREMRPPPK